MVEECEDHCAHCSCTYCEYKHVVYYRVYGFIFIVLPPHSVLLFSRPPKRVACMLVNVAILF